MPHDILNLSFREGAKVRIKIRRWLGPREGVMTGESHLAGTAQVRRWTVTLPHNRTKTKTYQVSLEARDFEVLS
jgi:hypothetical protein